MNLNEYRKNAIIQILRLGLTAMAIFALPGILMGLTKPTLFVFSLFAVYPMVCLTPQLAKICSWELTTGTVIDVVLVNDHEQPYTEAHIRYLTEDNQERIVVTPIKEYGPYEKDCEPLLEKDVPNPSLRLSWNHLPGILLFQRLKQKFCVCGRGWRVSRKKLTMQHKEWKGAEWIRRSQKKIQTAP